MKNLNLWQWLGIALLVFGVAWYLFDGANEEDATAPTTQQVP